VVALVSVALWSAPRSACSCTSWRGPASPARGASRRWLLDIGFLSIYLHIGARRMRHFFRDLSRGSCFGNGFRFGLTWLRIAWAGRAGGFLAGVLTTPFWHSSRISRPGCSAG
jgi:two-component system sensor histidine kinase RpfC